MPFGLFLGPFSDLLQEEEEEEEEEDERSLRSVHVT
jgi:hypothetical protein